jgi:hypothetical protein
MNEVANMPETDMMNCTTATTNSLKKPSPSLLVPSKLG